MQLCVRETCAFDSKGFAQSIARLTGWSAHGIWQFAYAREATWTTGLLMGSVLRRSTTPSDTATAARGGAVASLLLSSRASTAAGISAAFTTVSATGTLLPITRPNTASARPAMTFVAYTGQYTFEPSSTVITNATTFDMASCSKILGATTAAAQLYQAGLLDLDAPVTPAVHEVASRTGLLL